MANIDNNLFNWCTDMVEVRTNYSPSQCLEIVKKRIASFSGADSGFRRSVLESSPASFEFDCRFVPVYRLDVLAQYSWTEKTKDYYNGEYVNVTVKNETDYTQERQFSKFFYKGLRSGLEMDSFIGGQDQRFYQLNLPSDLEYPIYNVSTNCYTINQLNALTGSVVAPTRSNESCHILGWECVVYFVPTVEISYTYNGTTYYATVNQHNGTAHVQYMISNESAQLVEEIAKKNKIYFFTTLPISIGVLLFSLNRLFSVSGSVMWDIVFSILAFTLMVFSCKSYKNKSSLMQSCGSSLDNAYSMKDKIFYHFIVRICSAVLILVLQANL